MCSADESQEQRTEHQPFHDNWKSHLTMAAWLVIFVPVCLDIKSLTRATGCYKMMERPHGNSTIDGLDMDRLGYLQQGSRWREKNPWYCSCSPSRKMGDYGKKNSEYHRGRMRQNKVHIHSLVMGIYSPRKNSFLYI